MNAMPMDALTHAIESYMANGTHPASEAPALPGTLAHLGLTEAMVEPICEAAMESPNIEANPRPMTVENLREVVDALL